MTAVHVVVVGAGQVGRAVAETLSEEHSVHVIDTDPTNLEQVPYHIDVTRGDGTEREVLEEARLGEADILIATTNLDQTNLVICNTAKLDNQLFTIARVTSTDYLKTWQEAPGAFGVDLMLGRAKLAAEILTRLIAYSSRKQPAREVEFYADGRVQMAVYEIPESSQLSGETVASGDRFQGVTFGAIFRGGEMIFPSGQDDIRSEDRIVVIGDPDRVEKFGRNLNPVEVETEVNDLLIFGGGSFGTQIARQLEKYSVNLKIIEKDEKRARYLAEDLPEALILNRDATDSGLWEREHLAESDMAIGTIGPDANNLLVSVLAKQKGISQVVSIVHEKKYVDVFESTDVDFVINPRDQVTEEIIRYIKVDYAENITSIEHHRGAVFEVEVGPESELLDRKIDESVAAISERMTVGAIIRRGKVLTPRGATKVEEGDRLVILADADQAEEIAERVK